MSAIEPPRSDRAEKAILTSTLFEPTQTIDKCTALGLRPDSFYSRRDQILFEAILALDSAGKPIDEITISEYLTDIGDFDKVGGYDYLTALTSELPEIGHVRHYTEIVIKKHRARLAIQSCADAMSKLYESDDPDDVVADHAAELQGLVPNEERSTADIFSEALHIDEMVASGERVGLPFPWEEFQRKTHGIPRRAVTPMAGRDGKGKSRLATFLAEFWVCDNNIPILYFPFEDTAERFATNFSATHYGYDAFSLKGNPSPQFMEKHREGMKKMPQYPIYIEDLPTTAARIASKIGAYKRKFGIEGVVIDGFKDIELNGGENQTSKEGDAMACLVAAAKRHDVAILVVMHLRDIDDNLWITKREIRGNKVLTQSSRMTLIYQDAGIPEQLVNKFSLDTDSDIILDCQKCSYGDKAVLPLTPALDEGTFKEFTNEPHY